MKAQAHLVILIEVAYPEYLKALLINLYPILFELEQSKG